jgi:hypothetical protein
VLGSGIKLVGVLSGLGFCILVCFDSPSFRLGTDDGFELQDLSSRVWLVHVPSQWYQYGTSLIMWHI